MPFEFEYEGNNVKDTVPDETEIIFALFKMRNRKAPGLSRISVDDLKHWYHQAHPKDDEEAVDLSVLERWNAIVKIIQGCFNGRDSYCFHTRCTSPYP